MDDKIDRFLDYRQVEGVFTSGLSFVAPTKEPDIEYVAQPPRYYKQYGMSRGVRALELYLNDAVYSGDPAEPSNMEVLPDEVDYYVASQQTRGQYYHVGWHGSAEWSNCTCTDHVDGHYVCKHIIAVFFMRSDQRQYVNGDGYENDEVLLELDESIRTLWGQDRLDYFETLDPANFDGKRLFIGDDAERAFRIELWTAIRAHQIMALQSTAIPPINDTRHMSQTDTTKIVYDEFVSKRLARVRANLPYLLNE